MIKTKALKSILQYLMILGLISILTLQVKGQTAGNLSLLEKQNFKDAHFEKKIVRFGISGNNNFLIRYNPVSLGFSSLMFMYQKFISPQISADCLFKPTCSEFSRQCFIRYGLIKGLFVTADRLNRCDRISATAIEPIEINEEDNKVHETTDRYCLQPKGKLHSNK